MGTWVINELTKQHEYYSSVLMAPLLWDGNTGMVTIPPRVAGVQPWAELQADVAGAVEWAEKVRQRCALAKPPREPALEFRVILLPETVEMRLRIPPGAYHLSLFTLDRATGIVSFNDRVQEVLTWQQFYWVMRSFLNYFGIANAL